jgi:hypothetical protein
MDLYVMVARVVPRERAQLIVLWLLTLQEVGGLFKQSSNRQWENAVNFCRSSEDLQVGGGCCAFPIGIALRWQPFILDAF